MTIKECYEQIGANYEDVRSRLRSDLLIRKFFLKFPDDKDGKARLAAKRETYADLIRLEI